MKTQHTPGPWVHSNQDDRFIVCYPANKMELRVPIRIASVCFTNGDREIRDWEVAQANARLIAAAPELLEALVSLYTKFRGDGLGKDKWYGPTMEIAKQAISKATGEKEAI